MYGLIREPVGVVERFNILKNVYLKGMDFDVYCVTNDIKGLHTNNKNESRAIDDKLKLTSNELNTVFKTICPKEVSIIEFENEISSTKDIVKNISEKYKDQKTFSSPIQNIVSKHFKINKVLELAKKEFKNYNVILMARMDCQFIPKLDLDQIKDCNKSLYILSPFWAKRPSFNNNISDENNIKEFGIKMGFPEDFFYGKPQTINMFSDYYTFLKEIDPTICTCHPESIFNAFIRKNKFSVELIKWSKEISIDDFNFEDYSITDTGHSYPPEISKINYNIKHL